jgi:hypothetical protein
LHHFPPAGLPAHLKNEKITHVSEGLPSFERKESNRFQKAANH